MKHLMRLSFVMLVVVGLLVGCGQSAGDSADSEPAADAADVAFKITGMVDSEKAWPEDEIKAMDTMDAESTNKDGETNTYTGVSMNALLDAAGVQDGAATVTLIADDGYSVDVVLDEVRGCSDCIISFRSEGGFTSVLPGFPGNTGVKGIIEMQVK